jgi:hypothetical protein
MESTDKIESPVNPTVSDDSTKGYLAGDEWVNTVDNTTWILADNAAGAAVWNLIPTINDAATNSTINTWSAGKITTALLSKADTTAFGYAVLDSTGKIATGQIPALAITDVFVVANISARDALVSSHSAETGDVAKLTTDLDGRSHTYILSASSTWVEIVDRYIGTTEDVPEIGLNPTNRYFTETRVETYLASSELVNGTVMNDLSTSLSSEISSRLAGTSLTSSALSTEVFARSSADQSLATLVSSEISTRASDVSAETSLRISTVSAETSSRVSGDASLQTQLSTEISSRESAVSAEISLRESALSVETSSRVSGDALLSSEISTETSVRASADSSLSVSLSSEVSSRASADSSLSVSLSSEVSSRASADSSLSVSLSSEVSSRASADAALSLEISAEISSRIAQSTTLVSTLSTDIYTHENDLLNPHETTLTQAIAAEVNNSVFVHTPGTGSVFVYGPSNHADSTLAPSGNGLVLVSVPTTVDSVGVQYRRAVTDFSQIFMDNTNPFVSRNTYSVYTTVATTMFPGRQFSNSPRRIVLGLSCVNVPTDKGYQIRVYQPKGDIVVAQLTAPFNPNHFDASGSVYSPLNSLPIASFKPYFLDIDVNTNFSGLNFNEMREWNLQIADWDTLNDVAADHDGTVRLFSLFIDFTSPGPIFADGF